MNFQEILELNFELGLVLAAGHAKFFSSGRDFPKAAIRDHRLDFF